ncbi:unnamed protein product [Spirodela intermedia]|uniref:Uncharacterized protein n=1 Tax=Spirodela intermedia TaxID=51605 RepID=A0A7I8K6H3_SPIIN|nr:unnamed protein product [Spirodela intermedia]
MTTYHPQANSQVEVCNMEVKKILKKMIRLDGKKWVNKLFDALWAYETTYKSPSGMSLYKVIYWKTCHLLVEIEHKAY